MFFNIDSARKELEQKKKELERLDKIRAFQIASIAQLEEICSSFEESVPEETPPQDSLIGGQELIKYMVDIFVQQQNMPMQASDIIAILEKLPQPIKTTASRITSAVHNSKGKFFETDGRGVYKLKEDVFLDLLKKRKEHPNM